MTIRRVWIEEGCISCNLCEDLAPEVFEVPPGSESKTRKKYERHLKSADVQEKVQEAADSCPVEVIQVEKDPD
ncbi:MAG: ferredoxin [Planctomycetota bacterium]